MMLTKLKYAGIAPAITNAMLHQIGTMIVQSIFPPLVFRDGAWNKSINTLLYRT